MKTPRALFLITLFALTADGASAVEVNCENNFQCMEKRILTTYPKLFARNNLKLTVQTKAGKKVYVDSLDSDGNKSPEHILIQYYPELENAVLYAGYPESPWYIILNTASGIATKVKGFPVLSPDRRRYAIAHVDLEFNDDSVLQIYRLTRKTLALEFNTDNENSSLSWGPSSAHWLSPTELTFTKTQLRRIRENNLWPKGCETIEQQDEDKCRYTHTTAKLSCNSADQTMPCVWSLTQPNPRKKP